MTDMFQPIDLPSIDPEKDYFSELVGEGKKYADQKAAGRAIVEKDRFIEQLKRENAGVRSELSKRESEENILRQIEERTRNLTPPPPQPSPTNQGDDRRPVEPDTKVLEERLVQLMNQKEVERQMAQNESLVNDKLKQAYGENYQLHVKQEASKLGVGTEFLSDLARKQPQAFFKLLGLDDRKPISEVTPPSSTFRPTGTAHGDKTYSYYENLRKTKPTEYWSPRIQNEMMKQLEVLGQEEFYK